ncbi:peptide-binding protein [Pullulanibacillus sp. KACC 23026]|uniref:peptide-binding protein n=1 Tax=Pullulanibacillus sp. KACC 23026 TaxID=3028315 RepID=UPI0023B19F54|nr:peptide-binding protein [Pullulanibacillus sp. KACC 23026]WEG12909.1 peptide-binding protein [Pullulanibacillus sp. KACC 23026]
MKKSRSLILLLSIVVVLSLVLSACGSTSKTSSQTDTKNTDSTKTSSGKPQDGGDLIVGSIGSPTTFNPYYSTDIPSGDIEGFIFNGLTTVDKNLKPVGDLAKSWDVSSDGLTYTFHLKSGVKWQDGKPFTADDVVFSYNIPRSKDYTGARGSDFEQIKDIKALDSSTVQITLKEPYAPFLTTTCSYGILPKHILGDVPIKEMDKADFNTKDPIGTGPYKFVEWKDGQYVKVEKNPDYFDGPAHINTITYKIVPDANALLTQFQAGDIDYMDLQSTDLATGQNLVQQGKAKIQTTLALDYTFIGYNEQNPLFKDPKVRQALTYALDRNKIIKSVLNGDGKIANTPGSPLEKWAYNPDVPSFDYNPAKAKKLLAEAGWKPGPDGILEKDGKKFSFTIKTNQGNTAREQIAQVAQQMWKQIGVEATPKIEEWSAFIQEVTTKPWKFDACILGWSLSVDPDPTAIFASSQAENGLNFVHYSDPAMDKLMAENTSITDQTKRGEVIKQIQAGIAQDQPYSFLYYPNAHIMYNPKLQNVQQLSAADYYHIKDWWIKQN